MNRTPTPGRFYAALDVLMRWIGERQYGYAVPFMPEIFRTYGVRRGMKFLRNMEELAERLHAHLPTRDAQFHIALASLWNGCEFCSRGHLHAAALYHLQATGKLFPFTADSFLALARLPDNEAMAKVYEALAAPEFEALRKRIERQYALKLREAEPQSLEDQLLQGANVAWEWLNECTIVIAGHEVPPLAPIAKDRALRAQYAELLRSHSR